MQENLRASIWARLERGELTGKGLARQAGFQQAHLSNFLNARRGLSLTAMDRLLDVLHLDVLDLAGAGEFKLRSANASPHDPEMETVAVVSLQDAARSATFSSDQVQDTVNFKKSFLRTLKPRIVGNRRDWTRFVVAPVDKESARGMEPMIKLGARALIDRYYNTPSEKEPWNGAMYAVVSGGACIIRCVAISSGILLLRPYNERPDVPIQTQVIPTGRRHSDFIVGRIRHLTMQV